LQLLGGQPQCQACVGLFPGEFGAGEAELVEGVGGGEMRSLWRGCQAQVVEVARAVSVGVQLQGFDVGQLWLFW